MVQVVPRLAHGPTASGQKLVALPVAVNDARCGERRSPIMWQFKLIDQVMWCSTATRTRPARRTRSVHPPGHGDEAIE